MISSRALDAPDELVSTVDGFLESDEVPVDASVTRVCRADGQLLLIGTKRALLPVLIQALGVVPLIAPANPALKHVVLRVLEANKARHVALSAEAANEGCCSRHLRNFLAAQVV